MVCGIHKGCGSMTGTTTPTLQSVQTMLQAIHSDNHTRMQIRKAMNRPLPVIQCTISYLLCNNIIYTKFKGKDTQYHIADYESFKWYMGIDNNTFLKCYNDYIIRRNKAIDMFAEGKDLEQIEEVCGIKAYSISCWKKKNIKQNTVSPIYTESFRKRVLDYYSNGHTIGQTSKVYNIDHKTISRWLKAVSI